MSTYRVRINAYNPDHPEFGSVDAVIRVTGFNLDDAWRKLWNGISMNRDESTVILASENRKGLGYGAKGFPCWDVITPMRTVYDGMRPIRVIGRTTKRED